MNSSLIEKELKTDTFDEYIEKIVDIFKLSNKTSSIIFDLKISNYKVFIRLSIINRSGDKKEFNDVVLDYDNEFYNSFLVPLLAKINMFGKIVYKDIVDLDDDPLVTLRLISMNNDLFTIDGLSIDDGNSLLKMIEDSNK